jgi:hypothetical protein
VIKATSLLNNNLSQAKEVSNVTSNPLTSTKTKALEVFCQNTSGLTNKTNELEISMCSDFLCLLRITEHCMVQLELEHIYIQNYK